jgi:hypothetical protein
MKWWLLLILGVLCGEYGWSCMVWIWIQDGNSRLYLTASSVDSFSRCSHCYGLYCYGPLLCGYILNVKGHCSNNLQELEKRLNDGNFQCSPHSHCHYVPIVDQQVHEEFGVWVLPDVAETSNNVAFPLTSLYCILSQRFLNLISGTRITAGPC